MGAAALATTMAGCAGGAEPDVGDATGATAQSTTLSPPAPGTSPESPPASTSITPSPAASSQLAGDAAESLPVVSEAGQDGEGTAAGRQPAPAPSGVPDDSGTLEPLEGTVYVMSTQNVIGAQQVAELIPVPLADTEEAAFHTAFMLMNTADDVYAAAPDQPGDLSFFAAISAPECAWCSSVMDTARTAAASSFRVTGGEFTAVGDSFDGERIEDGSVVVSIPVQEAPTEVWNPDGTLAAGTDGGASTLNVQLEWREDLWMVTGVSTT